MNWPVGEGVSGSEALVDKVKSTPHALGYVEVNHAAQKKQPYGSIRNSSGKFVIPDLMAQNAAVRAKPQLENDFRVLVVNAPAKDAYPITTISWLLVPKLFKDGAKGRAMGRFLRWTYSAGLEMAGPLEYGLLPPEMLDRIKGQIDSVKSQ